MAAMVVRLLKDASGVGFLSRHVSHYIIA